MLFSSVIVLAGAGSVLAASYASRPPYSTVEPSLTQIAATQATQQAISPVSNAKGIAFDRIVHIWMENTVHSLPLIFIVSSHRALTDSI